VRTAGRRPRAAAQQVALFAVVVYLGYFGAAAGSG